MLPAGEVTESHVELFAGLMDQGDILVDGGNSFYKDNVRRSRVLAERGIHFLDAGVSGGIWGREEGYCLMVGGEEHAFRRIEPILQTLAPPEGYLRCGPAGSGHFIKMVHNGIEYALMQAYGEGFNIVKNSPFAETVPLEQLAHVWNRGSVVRSWLLELLEKAFRETPNLEVIAPYVEDSGEGRWTVQQAVESGTPAPVITLALFERFASRGNAAFSNTILAALRNQFGGHAVTRRES
jgi:6-phosphogluconate dehydrogenase